jgi:hypothetical protein
MSASQSSASFEVTSVLVGSGNNNQGEYGGAPGRTVKTTASSTKIRRLKRKRLVMNVVTIFEFQHYTFAHIAFYYSIAKAVMPA